MGDKGKGVARGEESKEKADASQGLSFLSQVASSASGLARSAFTAPTSNELNEGAIALSSAGKGQYVNPQRTAAEVHEFHNTEPKV